jgi:Flp pilus assembly pilin Flp
MKKFKKTTRRQGMTEYVIIVGLIAIVMIPTVTKFKTAMSGAFDEAGSTLTSKVTNELNGSGTQSQQTTPPSVPTVPQTGAR